MALSNFLLDKVASLRTTVKINRYLFAFISVIAVLIIRLLLSPVLQETAPLLLFIISIMLSAWYGGFGPGMFATVLCLAIGSYLFSTEPIPNQSYIITIIIRLLLFFIEGFIISLLIEARNKAEKEREEILLREKIARRNAQQQIRIREHFISVASHELKSPLTSQKAYIQLLKASLQENDKSKLENYVIKIDDQTIRLTNFINDLLDVTKMNSRKLQFQFAHFSLSDCVREAIDDSSNLLIGHKVQVKGEIKKQVHGDKERIYQVVTNLLSNAIKYSPEGKRIIVMLSENKKFATVSIKDFGVGIDPENQKKIFKRFFRISGSDESAFKGLGLGLYITAQIIKRHKGEIVVESKLGKGSTFSIKLPIKVTKIV